MPKFNLFHVLVISLLLYFCSTKTSTENAPPQDPNELSKVIGISLDSADVLGVANYKALRLINEDLDGDGNEENISIRVSPNFYINDEKNPLGTVDIPAIIVINKKFVRVNLHVNSFYPNGDPCLFKVIDFQKTDNFKEVYFSPLIHGIDPPGVNQILRFNQGQLLHYDIPGDNKINDHFSFDGNGRIFIKYTIGYDSAYDISKNYLLTQNAIRYAGSDTGRRYTRVFTQ
jgi:hypothetical protein